MDRETVSKSLFHIFPGLAPRSLGLDHTFNSSDVSYWREQRLDDNDRRLEIAYRLAP